MASRTEPRPKELRADQRAPRVALTCPVDFTVEESVGAGLIANLSASGALVRHASQRLYPPTRVALQLRLASGTVYTDGIVVRETADGFAVRFLRTSPGSLQFLLETIDGLTPARERSAERP